MKDYEASFTIFAQLCLQLLVQRPELKFVDGTLREEVDDFDDVARSVAIQSRL